MKKYLLVLVCCVMLALVGCGKRKLVGTWEVAEYVVDGETVSVEDMGMTEETLAELTLVFNEDGTGSLGEFLPFTWSKDGKTITITQEYLGKTKETKVEKDGKTLKFYADAEDTDNYTVYKKSK